MKETTRRFVSFAFYDHTGMEKHLARMARQGWLLERMSGLFWRYRRIEPVEASFAVLYLPKLTGFEPVPSDEQLELDAFCARTGWTFVASADVRHVYYNVRPDAVPLETEPAVQVETIQRAARKHVVWPLVVPIILPLFWLYLAWQYFRWDPVGFLADSLRVFWVPIALVMPVLAAISLLRYVTWLGKARRDARAGRFRATPPAGNWMWLVALMLCLFVLLYAAEMFVVGVRIPHLIFLGTVVATAAIQLVVAAVATCLKNKRTPALKNRRYTSAVSVVLALLLWLVILPNVTRTIENRVLGRQRIEQDGVGWTEARTLPLDLADLFGAEAIEYDDYSRVILNDNESFLLGRYSAHQSRRPEARSPSAVRNLDYDVTTLNTAFLYDEVKAYLLGQSPLVRLNPHLRAWARAYTPADPLPWRALDAYRLDDGDPVRAQYLLCYPDRFVEITCACEMTAEQMRIVAAHLGG